jgi:Fumarylacetoacetate (FAA) hydrolase family
MRFATYNRGGGPAQAAVVSNAGLHSLPSDVSVLGLVRAGLPAALAAGQRALGEPAVPLDAVRLLPPLTPPTVRDFVAFEEHVDGIAVVVGRGGASLSAEQARDHIFGYTVLNDWSARDLQRREMKVLLGPAKGKDFASTLGPWLVTADEFEPYRDSDGFPRHRGPGGRRARLRDLRQRRVPGRIVGPPGAHRPAGAPPGRHRRADRRRDRHGTQPRGAGAYAAAGTRSTRPFGTPGEKARITSGCRRRAAVTTLTGIGDRQDLLERQ